MADTRRLLSDWLEPKNHGGDHGLNEHAHSDGDHRRDHRQYDTLGFNATDPTHGDHRGDHGGDHRGDHREWGRCLSYRVQQRVNASQLGAFYLLLCLECREE